MEDLLSRFNEGSRFLLLTLLELFERTGLGSSLGAGDGKTAAAFLNKIVNHVLHGGGIFVRYLCVDATCGSCGNDALDILVRGVGRTGAPVPVPVIQDFFVPNSALRVTFEESTSLSDRVLSSGGRRISQSSRGHERR